MGTEAEVTEGGKRGGGGGGGGGWWGGGGGGGWGGGGGGGGSSGRVASGIPCGSMQDRAPSGGSEGGRKKTGVTQCDNKEQPRKKKKVAREREKWGL